MEMFCAIPLQLHTSLLKIEIQHGWHRNSCQVVPALWYIFSLQTLRIVLLTVTTSGKCGWHNTSSFRTNMTHTDFSGRRFPDQWISSAGFLHDEGALSKKLGNHRQRSSMEPQKPTIVVLDGLIRSLTQIHLLFLSVLVRRVDILRWQATHGVCIGRRRRNSRTFNSNVKSYSAT